MKIKKGLDWLFPFLFSVYPVIALAGANIGQASGFWLYPLLAGAYPALALIAVNTVQMNPIEGVRAILAGVVLAGIFVLVSKLLARDWGKAAVLSTFWVAVFFSYGHIYQAIEGTRVGGFVLGRHLVLAPLALLILFVGSCLLLRYVNPSRKTHQLFTIMVVILVALALFQTGFTWWRMNQPQKAASIKSDTPAIGLPDIYLIILDAYSRADTLEKYYEFDNSTFISTLRDMDFIVSDCSFSNYSWTALSMSSMLNMDYLIQMDGRTQTGDEHLDYPHYADLIANSEVRRILEGNGYQIVAIPTGYAFTSIANADVYITEPSERADFLFSAKTNAFEELFLRTTGLRIATESFDAWFKQLLPDERSSYRRHYDRVLFQLNEIGNITEVAGPKFVFIHIPAPHPPFVFTEGGTFRYTREVDVGYPEEIAYLNTRIDKILATIINQSAIPPIIILQGDHGWPMDARTEILYAVYLPGFNGELPYQTPVNAFRHIFNYYFDGDFPLLYEESYFSTEDRQLALTPVPLVCSEAVP